MLNNSAENFDYSNRRNNAPLRHQLASSKTPQVKTRQGCILKNEMGRPCLIHKDKLIIDPLYQRERVTSEATIRKIIAEWDWMACGSIWVAERRDNPGQYHVYDGGGRVLAARMIDEITELPCLVWTTDGPVQEANAFRKVNTQRRSVTPFERHKSGILTGEHLPNLIQKMMDDCGYTLVKSANKGRTFGALYQLTKLLKSYPDATMAGWKIVVDVANGEPINETMMTVICYMERELMAKGSGESLGKDPYRKLLKALGPVGIREECMKGSKMGVFKRGSEKSYALGLLEALNYNRHKRCLLVLHDGKI